MSADFRSNHVAATSEGFVSERSEEQGCICQHWQGSHVEECQADLNAGL